MNDVDLNEDILYVRETKFYKTRLVPLGQDLKKALHEYYLKRNITYANEKTASFFCLRSGKTLSQSAVGAAFRRLRILAKVSRDCQSASKIDPLSACKIDPPQPFFFGF